MLWRAAGATWRIRFGGAVCGAGRLRWLGWLGRLTAHDAALRDTARLRAVGLLPRKAAAGLLRDNPEAHTADMGLTQRCLIHVHVATARNGDQANT